MCCCFGCTSVSPSSSGWVGGGLYWRWGVGWGVGVRELYLTWSFCSACTLPVFTSCERLLAQQWFVISSPGLYLYCISVLGSFKCTWVKNDPRVCLFGCSNLLCISNFLYITKLKMIVVAVKYCNLNVHCCKDQTTFAHIVYILVMRFKLWIMCKFIFSY